MNDGHQANNLSLSFRVSVLGVNKHVKVTN